MLNVVELDVTWVVHWACTSDSKISKSGSYSYGDLLPLSSESGWALNIELENEEVVVVTLNPITCTSIGPHPKLLDCWGRISRAFHKGDHRYHQENPNKSNFENTANGVFNAGLVTGYKLQVAEAPCNLKPGI